MTLLTSFARFVGLACCTGLGSLLMAADAPKPAANATSVEIIAHRGASYDAPENTLAAVKLAWEQQADAVEFDVYLTKDGQIIGFHDKDTRRTTGKTSNLIVSDSTAAELRALDVGSWKHPRFAGERPPLLPELLATVPDGKQVFIEVKCGPEITDRLVHDIDASGLEPEQTAVIAFDADVIAAVKAARPELPAYWLSSLKEGKAPSVHELIAIAERIHADGLDLQATEVLDEAFATAIHDAGLELYVWTVNDVELAQRMISLGVRGITTDRPAWLRQQLAR